MPLDKTEIAVGDSARLEIIFFTKDYHNRVTRHPLIQTNETTHEWYSITLEANIFPSSAPTPFPLTIAPPRITMYQMNDSIIDNAECIITNNALGNSHLSIVSMPSQYITDYEISNSLPSGITGSLRFHLTDYGINHNFDKSITLESKDTPNRVRYTIPIVRRIRY